MAGLSSAGFERKRLEDIKTDLENALKSSFGDQINLLPESVFGQLVGIWADRLSSIWELGESVYNSQYPDTAYGTSLDNVAALSGITRLGATKSTVTVELTGTIGTVVPAGTIFSVSGNSDARFVTLAPVTLVAGAPSGTVDCEAETAGEVQAAAGTLTVIETPVFGLTSVTNPLDADVGREIETDLELRIRRATSLQIAGAGTPEAIRSRLLEVDDVTAVIVYENITMVTDPDGRPPKSFEVFVEGGDDQDIADTIWLAKPAGIETYGNQSTSVTDSQGFTQTINWSRPIAVDIYLEVDLVTTPSFVATEAEIKQAFVDYATDNLGIGDDVIVYPALMCVLNAFAGISDVTFRIGVAPGPTLDNNIPIDPEEIADFDTSRITVTIT